MKTKLNIIIVVVSVFFGGITYGQDDFLTLSSSQFLKGLDNQDYLRTVLTDNGFTLIKKWKVQNINGGIYEYWGYKNFVFVDMIMKRGQKTDIVLRIIKDFPDLPERLLETFPRKRSELQHDYISKIKVTHIDRKKAYSLHFSEEGKNLGVYVWFDDPFYYFEYTVGQ
jgi:hypothetical protein